MKKEEIIKMSKGLNSPTAIVMAGKMIADAIDKHTELQMKMAGMSSEMMKKMMKLIEKSTRDGDDWKTDDDDEKEGYTY